ncbi:3-isopropylmalate dehydratase small subunit [Pseudomonas sp. BF-R-26]|uniref:3-isopropylmalate dehydratase small subunit n=1 Tax=Pseudomonas sp. BF-R-26 TaxID=2832398 RepID=UPI001CC0633E|nr:3-isopropylmalate dehydratase small subunit [Pseudomonas sp. BF-R-26]
MKPFQHIAGVAAALPLTNIDTDKILPARFLKTIRREGLADGLFAVLREDPAFVLNRSPWHRAEILVALDNFGCGSSREHAPWALLDFGIRCIIAPGFADIFYNNCFKNGILPVVLPRDQVDALLESVSDPKLARIEIDLPKQTVQLTDGRIFCFSIDPARKRALLEGLDDIGNTLTFEDKIAAFEAARRESQPWLPSIPMEL